METTGYHDKHIRRHRIQLLPNLSQVLLYLILSLFMVMVLSRDAIVSWLSGESLETLGGTAFITQNESYYLDALFSIPVLGTISVVIFWATLGCGVYCVAWGLTNTVKEAKKYDEAVNDSVLPKGYNKHKFWETTAANIILMISSLCIFLFILLFSVGYALPAAEQLLLSVLSNTISLDALLATIIFLAMSIVLGHGIYLSLHAFNYARKIVFF